MEIQQGKGPWASPVTGIVPLGTTLTMVVGIDDKEGKNFKIYICWHTTFDNFIIRLNFIRSILYFYVHESCAELSLANFQP